ncbi:MAG: terpene cyclase/mutase family protein, partial [Oscillospiraceae bacterium]|nr:terpene cyclase/mutase family protein [Oscillospiraceae bacterium]
MLRNFTIRALAALLAIIVMAAAPLSALAVDYQGPYNGVKDHLAGKTPSFGSVGGEWLVFALARGGRVSPSGSWCSNYYDSIEAMVRENGSNILNPNKATENSRLAIALTSIGRDARSVAGYDLISPLTDLDFVKRQGVTGVAFALLAMNARSSYGETSAKNACVEYLLGKELDGGGWSLGTTADTDVTAMAVTALAPFSNASSAVGRGIAKLSSMQDADGGFSTMGTPNCESCAQTVIALSACGVDADTDARFIKNGSSALAALLSYYKGSGFSHTQNGPVNQMASEQAACALCAY